jgi:hypothetical protein
VIASIRAGGAKSQALKGAALAALLATGLLLVSPPSGPPDAGAATPICGDPMIVTANFDGGGDGTSWDDPDNWADDSLPDSADVVCISAAGPVVVDTDVTIQGLEAQGAIQVVTGGGLTLANQVIDSSIATLQQAGGAVGGKSDLTISDFVWTGGVHFTSAPVTPQATTTVTQSLSIPAAGAVAFRDLNFRTLMIPNGVTGTFTGGLGIRFGGGVLEIQQGGIFDISPATGAGILATPSGTIINDGTLRRTSGADEVSIAPELQNDGVVVVQTGRLRLRGGGSTDADGGNFVISSGTELVFDGGTFALGASTISDGPDSATAEVRSGALDLSANGALDVANALVSGSGIMILGGSNTVPTLSQTGGTLAGAGNLSVGTLTWTGGTQAATDNTTRTTVTSSLTLASASVKSLFARTLRLAGGATGTHGAVGALDLNSNARLETQPSGLFDLANPGATIGGDGTGTIDNDGTLLKSGGGTSNINPAI